MDPRRNDDEEKQNEWYWGVIVLAAGAGLLRSGLAAADPVVNCQKAKLKAAGSLMIWSFGTLVI
jgi:hypothetical protein